MELTMTIHKFETSVEDIAKFISWSDQNPGAWAYKVNRKDQSLRFHEASCRSLRKAAKLEASTELYLRVCSTDAEKLRQYIVENYNFRDEGECGDCSAK